MIGEIGFYLGLTSLYLLITDSLERHPGPALLAFALFLFSLVLVVLDRTLAHRNL